MTHTAVDKKALHVLFERAPGATLAGLRRAEKQTVQLSEATRQISHRILPAQQYPGRLRRALAQLGALVQRVLDVAADAHYGIAGCVDGVGVETGRAILLKPLCLFLRRQLLRTRELLAGELQI